MSDRRQDPLDLFRSLPSMSVDEGEIGQMQARVRDLIRVQELEREHAGRWPLVGRRGASPLARFAAAVLLVAVSGAVTWQLRSGVSRGSAAAESVAAAQRLAEVLDRMPLVEELDSPIAAASSGLPVSHSVYEIDAGDLDLVMIVGADLDL